MQTNSVLSEIDRLTQKMHDLARSEDWDGLTSLENARRTLLVKIDTKAARAPNNQALVQKIVSNNEIIMHLAQNRKEDIGLLLGAFGGPNAEN